MEEYRDSMRNIKRVFSKPQKYNEVENGLSPIILTRKDMLFCENQEAVKNTAVICSLLGSCKGCGVNSCEWLNYVNTKLAMLPRTQIEQESTGIASRQVDISIRQVYRQSTENPWTISLLRYDKQT